MIVLVGFMGAGKTTVGHLLADKAGLPFTDADNAIEAQAGMPVRDIFATRGEPAFRDLEHEVITGLLGGKQTVLALGGGAVQHPGTRRALAGHDVVYLEISYDEALARVGHDTGRPMLRAPGLPDIFRSRRALYEEVATLTVEAGGRSAEAVCQDVIARLHSGCA